MILMKDARSKTSIMVSIAYRFWKMCNGNQKVSKKTKKNSAKKDALKVECTVYCETCWQACTHDFRTDEKKFDWKVSKAQFYYLIREICASGLRKLEKLIILIQIKFS